jgi:hypothetical protein
MARGGPSGGKSVVARRFVDDPLRPSRSAPMRIELIAAAPLALGLPPSSN